MGPFKATTRPYFKALKQGRLNKLKKPVLKSLLKKKHLIDKLSSVFGLETNSSYFYNKLQSPFLNLHMFEDYSPKNKYFGSSLLKWQKIFKSLKTSSIYDYLQKLGTSEAALIGLLPTTAQLDIGITLLGFKPISTIGHRTYSKVSYNSDLWMLKLHEPYIKKFLNLCFSFQCSKNNILCFLKSYILQDKNSSDFLNKNPIHIKNTLSSLLFRSGSIHTEKLITKIKFLRQWSFLPVEHSKGIQISLLKKKIRLFPFVNDLFLVKQIELLKLLSFIKKNEVPKHDNNLRKFYYSKSWSVAKKAGFKSRIETLKELNNSLDISEYMLSSVFKRDEKRKSAYNFISQAKIVDPGSTILPIFVSERNKDAATPRVSLQVKPWGGTQNLINQPWISSSKYLSFKKLELSTNLRVKPFISIGQVSYKPVWTLPYQSLQNTNRLAFLSDNINYETNQNILVGSSRCARDNTKTTFNPITNNSVVLKPIYLNIEQIIYILKQTTKFRKNQRINPVFFDSSTRLNTVNTKKNYTSRAAHSHVWVLNSDFVFKNNSSHTTLKSQSDLQWEFTPEKNFNYFVNDTKKKTIKPFFFTPSSTDSILNDYHKHDFSYYSRLFSISRKSILNFSKQSMYFQQVFNEIMQPKLITPVYFSPLRLAWKSKVNDLGNEPYNINIYNSKISFNLRYTYPFKYTIFETFLPFINFPEKLWYLPKKTNSAFSMDNKESTKVFNSRMVFYPNFDYIQYNESFKIYTNLAYTCLKTYEPRLSKYRNFSRRNQKKYQTGSFQLERQTTSRLLSKKASRNMFVNFSRTYSHLPINKVPLFIGKNQNQPCLFQESLEQTTPLYFLNKKIRRPFKLLIQDEIPYAKNNKNGIFSTKYRKLYHEKYSAYPFLMLPDQINKTNGFLFWNQKLVTRANQKSLYWQIANSKKLSGYSLKNKLFLVTKYFRENKSFIEKLFKLPY